MLDFEKATWNALRSTYGGLDLVGCFFHWCQAIRRKMDQEGLAKSNISAEVRRMCRLLLALPLLPVQFIKHSFDSIISQATGPLLTVCAYMNRQWISSTVFPPESWSVLKMAVRTNNATEGWHKVFQVLYGILLSFSISYYSVLLLGLFGKVNKDAALQFNQFLLGGSGPHRASIGFSSWRETDSKPQSRCSCC